jgi:hypothetical protein
MHKKKIKILKFPKKGVSMLDYQQKGFAALDKVLQSGNGAALVAAAKMIFEATGLLKAQDSKPDDIFTVEFGISQPPSDKEKSA